jgi:hypothetical protein
VVDLLNCFEYSKEEALKTLAEVVDYKDYGGKHNESRFTKFHQNYFLVKKHGVEKRRAHIDSLVISGLLSREAAVEILATPLYKNQQEENEDIDYISKKLGISVEEFHDIMKSPSKNLSDFTSGQRLHKKIRPYLNAILKVGGKVKRMFK